MADGTLLVFTQILLGTGQEEAPVEGVDGLLTVDIQLQAAQRSQSENYKRLMRGENESLHGADETGWLQSLLRQEQDRRYIMRLFRRARKLLNDTAPSCPAARCSPVHALRETRTDRPQGFLDTQFEAS